jgi:hypothetical protein
MHAPLQAATPAAPRLRVQLFSALTAAMGALALGALWALLAIGHPGLSRPFAIVVGCLLAWVMRSTTARSLYPALLAALGTLLATGYAACLAASARLAAELGMPLGQVLASNGWHGALQLGWTSTHSRDIAWAAAAAVLAFVLTLVRRK